MANNGGSVTCITLHPATVDSKELIVIVALAPKAEQDLVWRRFMEHLSRNATWLSKSMVMLFPGQPMGHPSWPWR